MVVAAFHLQLLIFLMFTGFAKSSLLCACVKDNVHIYNKENQNMTAIIDTLISGNCVIHIDNNGAWVKVLTSKNQVGYIRAVDVTIRDCNHDKETGHRVSRFLSLPDTLCFSEHCFKCFCTHDGSEHGCSDCREHHLCKETKHYCSLWNSKVNGGWTAWSTYSACSVSCGGGGTMVRQRTCNNPTTPHGGAECIGTPIESAPCNTQTCSVNGGWTAWSAYSTCSVTCGSGTMVRQRTCSYPIPQNGGADCVGASSETLPCTGVQQCPVNGNWNNWSVWQQCSATCGTGKHFRYRLCENPRPSFGGLDCVGDKFQEQQCATNYCPTSTAIPTNAIQLTTKTSTTLHTCDKLGIVHALGNNLKITHSLAKPCQDKSLSSPETIAMEFCAMQRASTWRKGISVLDACNQHILTTQYVPVASYQGSLMNQYSGVFVGCEPGGFEIAMQLCGHPVSIHHITDTTTGSPFNPNNYYIVS